jgi:hypothetical protein
MGSAPRISRLAWRWPGRASVPRRRLGWALYIGVNIGLILSWGPDMLSTHERDWDVWRALGPATSTGSFYELGTELPYLLSPVLAPVMAFVGLIGPLPWAAVNVVMLAVLRDWRLIALILVSLGFWTNVVGGNTFTFVVVSAVLALRGSRSWALVFLGLLFLMPRPVQVPLAMWLLWWMPGIRLAAVGLFAVHAVVVVLTGLGPPWISAMLETAGAPWSIGPDHWIGAYWLAIGIPLAAFLLWRGHPGWAGVAASPYWVPHYFLMPLTEVGGNVGRRKQGLEGDATPDRSNRPLSAVR